MTKIKKIYLNKKNIINLYYKNESNNDLKMFCNLSKEYKKLMIFFKTKPNKIKIKFIYSREEMDKLWGLKSTISAMVDDNDPYLIYIFGPTVFSKITKRKISEMFSIIVHEIAHSFVTKINDRCFAWMNEGICEYVSINIDNKIKKENIIWFKKKQVIFDTKIDWRIVMAHQGYLISSNLVKYIIQKYSKDIMFKLLQIKRIKNKKTKMEITNLLDIDYNVFFNNFEKELKLI